MKDNIKLGGIFTLECYRWHDENGNVLGMHVDDLSVAVSGLKKSIT
jgi:hypothetical protein